jgi:translation elongation factor EF-Tu-like GTPase
MSKSPTHNREIDLYDLADYVNENQEAMAADYNQAIRDVVESSESLSLDNEGDREVLISKLLDAVDEYEEKWLGEVL